MSLTTDPKDPRLGHGSNVDIAAQNEAYLVLSQEELEKGFVRPVRTTYVHVGKKTDLKGGTVEPLSEEEAARHGKDYVAFIRYPESECPIVGRAIKQIELDNLGKYFGGCGGETKMHITIAETYARDPKFYGATYCVHCEKHLPVEEFVWLGTNETLGS